LLSWEKSNCLMQNIAIGHMNVDKIKSLKIPKIKLQKPTKTRKWIQLYRKSKQWHPLCCPCYKPGDKRHRKSLLNTIKNWKFSFTIKFSIIKVANISAAGMCRFLFIYCEGAYCSPETLFIASHNLLFACFILKPDMRHAY